MKNAFIRCSNNAVLSKVKDGFEAVKNVVEDSKKFGWNKNLPHGFRLIQVVETRFRMIFLVAERFHKSAAKVWSQVVTHNGAVTRDLFGSLEQSTHEILLRFIDFAAVEAIIDVFKPVYDSVIEFQAGQEPTLHKILLSLQVCKTESGQIETRSSVYREEGSQHRPSVYSKRLCAGMKRELEQIAIHDLWLVVCFLFLVLHDMAFKQDPSECETLTRAMCSEYDTTDSQSSLSGMKIHST